MLLFLAYLQGAIGTLTITGLQGILLMTGVLIGTTLWWLGISGIAALFMNRITGKVKLANASLFARYKIAADAALRVRGL